MNISCPICKQQMKPGWITTDTKASRWFVGTWTCPAHGEMRLSGHLLREGPEIKTHIPECPNNCGIAPVVQLTTTEWGCCSCGCRIKIRNGRLATYPNRRMMQLSDGLKVA
jgi:hypothetical protein